MSALRVLALILYFGLIPAIVVAAMVMAARRRMIVGARAAGLMFAGAGVLLLGHAFIPLGPLLGHALVRPDPTGPDVANLSYALLLIQLGLQAAGVGLIVAAFFAGRRTVPEPQSVPQP